MTNQSDYRYRWRFTHRSLALLEDDMLIGELVRLEGGEWALFAHCGVTRLAGRASLAKIVPWAERQLVAFGALPDGASIDSFAVMGGQNG